MQKLLFIIDIGHCSLNNDYTMIDDTMLFNIIYLELILLVIQHGDMNIESLSLHEQVIKK